MNGDIITGEIKELTLGILQYKTDDMGTVSVKWERVRKIQSTNFFEVETTKGLIYFGSFDTSGIQLDEARIYDVRFSLLRFPASGNCSN